jgi:hypothetical protein
LCSEYFNDLNHEVASTTACQLMRQTFETEDPFHQAAEKYGYSVSLACSPSWWNRETRGNFDEHFPCFFHQDLPASERDCIGNYFPRYSFKHVVVFRQKTGAYAVPPHLLRVDDGAHEDDKNDDLFFGRPEAYFTATEDSWAAG